MKIENILEHVEIGDIVLLIDPLNRKDPVGYVIKLSQNEITLGNLSPMRNQTCFESIQTTNYIIAPYDGGALEESHFNAHREFEILRKYKPK